MNAACLVRFGAGLLLWVFAGLAGAETFESLTRCIPRDANALVLMDVQQILQAPLAREQGWARKLETAYVTRPIFLPPEAKKLALGAALQPNDDFLPAWELAVMELAEPIGVRAIARGEGGYVDDFKGVQAAITPDNSAFVNLADRLLAAVRPADRQFLARWISFAGSSSQPEISEYLQTTLPLVSDRAQVVLAVDLAGVVSPHKVEERLAAATWLPAGSDRAAIASVLGTLRGAALRLAIGKGCQGQLQVDFDAEVAPLKDAAKPLVLHALDDLGFQTGELENWKVSLTPRSIHMQGALSADAQRRVFSVIELPAPKTEAAAGSTADAASGADSETRDSSLAYFKSTQVLLQDLRKGLKDTKATSAWMERYARRIDELPVLHVDELLLDYGDKLSETLRIMSLSKRQAGIRYGVRANEGGGSGGYYDGYSYGEDAYSRAADRSQAKKEEMAVASDTRVEGWRLIDNATADIRRTLTKKYNVEF